MPQLGTWANWAQVISIPVAIVAIVVSIWLYYRGRQRRALSCEFENIRFPIQIKADEIIRGDIEVRYKGKIIENLFLVRASLKNTGTLPIRRVEVVEPVAFEFGSNVDPLVGPRVIHREPDNLKVTFGASVEDETPNPRVTIFVHFDLLNSGDRMTIEFLCAGEYSLPRVMGRIEGVKSIELLDPIGRELRLRAHGAMLGSLWILVLVVLCVLAGWLGSLLAEAQLPDWGYLVGQIVIIVLGLALGAKRMWSSFVEPVWQWRRYRKRRR